MGRGPYVLANGGQASVVWGRLVLYLAAHLGTCMYMREGYSRISKDLCDNREFMEFVFSIANAAEEQGR